MPGIDETLISLLRIQSITGNELEICNWVQKLLESRMANVDGACVHRIKESLIVCGPQIAGRSTVAFAGHLDTVPGSDTGDAVRMEGDRIIGLGASDMKSGLAVMLELMRQDIILNSPYNIVQIYYAGEEGDHAASQIHPVLASKYLPEKVDLCFVLEPTDNTLQLGCMGSMHVAARFSGKRAHSARPWQGSNAIMLALPLMERLSRLTPEPDRVEGLEFLSVTVPTQIQSGDNARNVIPDSLELNINVRFGPSTDIAGAKQKVLELINGEATAIFTEMAPSCPVPVDNDLLQKFQQLFALERKPKQAYTDVAVFAEHGIPALNCGPGLGAQCHQAGEYVLLGDVQRSLAMFEKFLLEK